MRARPAGFVPDVSAVAGRALRAVPRDLEAVMPPVFIALFFFVVNIGTLSEAHRADRSGLRLQGVPDADGDPARRHRDLAARPRSSLDIQNGYFDRLLLTPMRRLAILLGHMVADVTVVIAALHPGDAARLPLGVRFETGVLGVLVFMLIAALWGLAFSGFGYAIALKTGNPAAVNTSFLLFFPFVFLTTSFVPEQALSGWLKTVAAYNPVTYLLAGLRSLVSDGWDGAELLKASAAIAAVGVVSISLALAALRGRVRRG